MSLNINKKSFSVKIICLTLLFLYSLFINGFLPYPELFIYNHTDSCPVGYYFILRDKTFSRGDMVIFNPPGDFEKLAVSKGWINKNDKLMKYIGAVSGDTFEIKEDRSFWVCGKKIGFAYLKDSFGNDLPCELSPGSYVVPEGYILPVSYADKSLDGRYFGVIKESELKKVKFAFNFTL